jgi:hypothetical protein
MFNFFIMGFVVIFNLLTFNFDKVNSLYILLPFDYFLKQWECLLIYYGWLQLVTKGNELKIHDFYSGKKYTNFKTWHSI